MEITENKLKEILSEQREVFQRHVDEGQQETRHLFGIMKEDFDSKLQFIGEQYGTLTEMMGAFAEDMQIVKSNVEFMKGSLRKKVDYDELSALEKRVAVLEAKAKK